ncbi:MAG: 4Fe-4S binding protein [Spirochaetaceae bacterium]|nr:MAG: 4Fe-4S binding protein [Spirochaetaceae bacterium]
MRETIPDHLALHGYRGTVVAVRHLRDLQEEIQDRYGRGLLHEDVYNRYLAQFEYQTPESITNARSLIVVAYADPPVRLTFSRKGKTALLNVPPTYLHAEAKDAEVERRLTELLAQEGYRVARALAPKKLLAARSGLARYGKNNIAYVEGLGSYHRLAVFCSDCPCEAEQWIEAGMLERCERCHACQRACPSGAIGSDRFLLRAERCLTFWNEMPKGIAFPDWVEDSWHNCLVGCLHCQRICPENGMLKDWYEEGAEFSDRETELILAGADPSTLPASLTEKLERWDLLELYDLLPRNLLACLENNAR